MSDHLPDQWPDAKPPGNKPVVNSIFDFTAEALGQLKLWFEQNPPTIPITSIPGAYNALPITGEVAATGIITAGTGFTANRTAVGTYAIGFVTKFAAVPVVVANSLLVGAAVICEVNPPTQTGVTIETFDTFGGHVDEPFNFLAQAIR